MQILGHVCVFYSYSCSLEFLLINLFSIVRILARSYLKVLVSLNLDLAGGLKIDFQYQSQANIQNVLARGTSPVSMGQAEVFAGDGLENYLDQQKMTIVAWLDNGTISKNHA